MVDAHDTTTKFLSKSRWGAKFLSKDSPATKEPKLPKQPKPQPNYKLDDDVNDFLKPSTEKAQAQKEAAAAAFASRPRIDVARAQRWPGANDVINSAAGKSPGVGGLKTGTRKKGLTVSFARTVPDIIGRGGDECDEPSIEVFKRKKSSSLSEVDKVQSSTHLDDLHLGLRTNTGDLLSDNKEAERRGIVTRTLTSHGELSPELRQKMEMGSINTHASPPLPPTKGLGQMGLGERPKPLSRAPTGFDVQQDGQHRPSIDSSFSYDSEASPVVSMKAPSLAPTREEEETEFVPKALKRAQTGWSEHDSKSNESLPPSMPPVPGIPRLPEMNLNDDDSPLDSSISHFLKSESGDPNSFSARVMQKMRADEGRVLHEAAQRGDGSKRDSGSSTSSFPPNTTNSTVPATSGTPPSSFIPMAGATPPRLPPREPPQLPPSPQRGLNAQDPYRSRVRGPSPGRPPMPPGAFPLDTSPRPPSSSSSQYTAPSAASKTRISPTGADPNSAVSNSSIHRIAASLEKGPFSSAPIHPNSQPQSATSQSSIQPTPPQYERPAYIEQAAEKQPSIPQHRPAPSQTVVLGRSDTRSQGDAAFTDFGERVQHMQGIFNLTAQLGGQIYDISPMQWLRAAIWWFLRGRTGMEALIRSRPKGNEPQPERLTQPHVDLAKAWWIVVEIMENHTGLKRYGNRDMKVQSRLAREAGDIASAEVYDIYEVLVASMKMLLGSMKRHQSMPPTQALIQGQDQSIWLEYPRFAPDVQSVLSGTASKQTLASGASQQTNAADAIPLGDTKTDFCYFRMFVSASLSTDDPNTDRVPLPAVISVLRSRDETQVKLSICSQNDLINIAVGTNPDLGPTWRDVVWKSKTRGFAVQLRHGFNLNVELAEPDFRSLWAIVDHTNRVETNLRERGDERLCLKMHLQNFSYKDSSNPGAFPLESVRGCKLMVFEKSDRSSEGTGRRRLHRGYRVVVVTNTKHRTLSCVTHEMGSNQEPMNFEYATDPIDNAAAMKLRFREETHDKKPKMCSMYIVFNDSKERNHLFGTFTSMNQLEDEAVFAQVPLKAFNIESADQAEGFTQKGSHVLERLKWQEVKVLNQDPEAVGLEAPPTVMSESLRFVCKHSAGIVSDRMNLGPGELLVRLPIDGAAELTLLRNPQQDMAVAVDASRSEKDVPDALADLSRTLATTSTIRKLTFNSFKDLHAFQLAVTGFHVKFDGIASTLQISRRRMVVPIYKQWTANTIRIQIVVQDNIVQLLAFFEEFSHADAMNFQLKSMDVFEKTDKGGKPGLRLADAKFALPVEERRGEGKMGKEEGRISGWAGMKRKFVCLDVIEYPGEHDDMVISFDSVETRDRFAEALPAATMERKFTVRRKI